MRRRKRQRRDPWYAGVGATIARRLFVVALLALVAARVLVDERPGAFATPDLARCKATYVIDGDTVTLTCPGGRRLRARLVGFDAPEVVSPACAAEREAGEAATRALERALASGARITFEKQGWDRYGRILVRMRLDGEDIAGRMIAAGLAAPGGWQVERDWCK